MARRCPLVVLLILSFSWNSFPPPLSSFRLCIYSQHLHRRFLWLDYTRQALQAFSNEISIFPFTRAACLCMFQSFFFSPPQNGWLFRKRTERCLTSCLLYHHQQFPPSTGNILCDCVPGAHTPHSELHHTGISIALRPPGKAGRSPHGKLAKPYAAAQKRSGSPSCPGLNPTKSPEHFCITLFFL